MQQLLEIPHLFGRTSSRDGIATNGVYQPNFSTPNGTNIGGSNGYLAKFLINGRTPSDTSHNPIDTSHNPIDTTHNPIDTSHNPIDTIVNNADSLSIVLYPIPNNGNFTIKGLALEKEPFEMSIFNMEGKLVIKKKLLQFATQHFYFKNQFASAVYVLRLKGLKSGIDKSFKFVVQQ